MRRITLHFEDMGSGFVLEDKSFYGDRLSLEDYEIGDYALHNENGEVVVMMETFTERGTEPLEYFIQDARRLNIPGHYDVPELGVENATFVEVLEAVKRYYQAKKQPVVK